MQQHVLCLSPAGLLRVVQLHQQLNLRPSRTCVKYMAAVLEQLLQQQQQQMPGSGGSAALQLVMCACGLSVWGVRLHLSAVAELLLRLERNKEQLPMTVLLQVSSMWQFGVWDALLHRGCAGTSGCYNSIVYLPLLLLLLVNALLPSA